MKQLTLLVLVMLMGVQAFGQKKKKLDPEEAALRIDSLTQANSKLSTQLGAQTLVLDSVNKDLAAHKVMYTAIKEKVMRHDFDPARTSELIDSLKAGRDQTLSGLTSEAQLMADSVALLSAENAALKATVSSLETRTADNEQVVHDLEQLKGLLDQKIITQAEFDTRKAKLMAKWK